MTETARLLLMLGLAGTAMTFLGSALLWFRNEPRRIRRALRRVLGAEPDALLIAQGRGRGAGFSLAQGALAVAWDRGAWCLVYRLDEILGAELIVDGEVVAKTHRDGFRQTLQTRIASADQVTLRLTLNDPTYPDFELDLWLAGDEARRDDWSPRAAVQEGDRWLARIDAIFRRTAKAKPQTAVQTPPAAVRTQPPARTPSPARAEIDDDDGPPWDEDED